MPRKGPAPRRELMPDPIYRSLLVTQLVNKVMLHGKRTIAEKIRNAALLPIPILGGTFDVTLSIGITLAEPGDTIDSLIARADNAMYEAKATGKNQVVTSARHTD